MLAVQWLARSSYDFLVMSLILSNYLNVVLITSELCYGVKRAFVTFRQVRMPLGLM